MNSRNVYNNKVNIFNESKTKYLPNKFVKKAIEIIFKEYKINDYTLNVVYCDNEYIKNINNEFLKHNYETDVLSFEIDKNPYIFEIYIGVEVAKLQAKDYKVSLRDELLRLAIHGALHLVGYDDHTSKGKMQMTELEDFYLNLVKG